MPWPYVPPEYRGRTWQYATSGGVVQTPVPPLRDEGDHGPLSQAFIDFQRYAFEQVRREHPDWFCDTCHGWLPKPTFDSRQRRCRYCVSRPANAAW